MLVSPVDDRLKALIVETAEAHAMTVHTIEVMPDPVHLFVAADPTVSVAEIVNRFKRRSSQVLRKAFAAPRSRRPTVWRRSDQAGSVGAGSEAVVRRSIEAHKRA